MKPIVIGLSLARYKSFFIILYIEDERLMNIKLRFSALRHG
jgi:hypothetical protein